MNLIQGIPFIDSRGKLLSFNDFSLEKIKRMYQITHLDISVVRAWQGHKLENKWFYVVEGAFTIAYVEIDDFENPSKILPTDFFSISAEDNCILNIPRGHANGLKAMKPNSKVIVFSDLTLEEANFDNYKFDFQNWLDWNSV